MHQLLQLLGILLLQPLPMQLATYFLIASAVFFMPYQVSLNAPPTRIYLVAQVRIQVSLQNSYQAPKLPEADTASHNIARQGVLEKQVCAKYACRPRLQYQVLP